MIAAPVTLTEFLAVPDDPATYRIDRLLPIGGRAVLAAQFKSGKSTVVANLLRSLADGAPFLGAFEVTRPEGPIVLIDDELDPRQLRRWLRDQGIVNTDRVVVLPLRGEVSSFDLLDPAVAAEWADTLRGASFIIFDCLRPVLDALGLSEDKDAGRFLVRFDELLKAAGIDGAVLVHHMGHAGERSRGDSRLLDWPDATWRLVRQRPDNGDEPDPAAPRFFTAFGRDVDVAEGAVTFDPESRRLRFVGGSRTEARASAAADKARPDVLAVLGSAEGPLSGREVETRVMARGQHRKDVRAALQAATADGSVMGVSGPKNSTQFSLNPSSSPVRRSSPGRTSEVVRQFASAPLGGARRTDTASEPSSAPPGEQDDQATPGRVCQMCMALADPDDPDGLCGSGDAAHRKALRVLGRSA